LDLPDKERVVAAPVRTDDTRDEVCERALDERGLVHELEARFGCPISRTPGEVVGELGLTRLQHAHAEPRSLVEVVAHPSATVDRDEHEWWPQRERRERVRGHAVDP